MKKMLLLIIIFLAGLIVGLILSVEQREKLSRPLADLIGGMVENIPDE